MSRCHLDIGVARSLILTSRLGLMPIFTFMVFVDKDKHGFIFVNYRRESNAKISGMDCAGL